MTTATIRRLTLGALAIALVAAGCRRPDRSRIPVIASTALIGAIVHRLGGETFAVHTIAPAGLCPGHLDLRPTDIIAANQARLILNHGWEEWYPRLVESIDNIHVRRITLRTEGNWMVPTVQSAAAAEIAAILGELAPRQADSINRRLARYQQSVDSAAAAARALLENRTLPPAICSRHQAPLLTWFGFRVVATYGRAEEFTGAELTRLARTAIDSGVGIIVDNLQSGPDAGRVLATELGIPHVTLTNFPLQGDYGRALLDNAAALAQVLP